MAQDDDPTAELEVVEGTETDVSIDPLAGEQLFDIPEEYLDDSEKGGAAPPATELDPAPADPRDKGKPGTQPRDDEGRFAKVEGEPPAAGKTGQPPAKPAPAKGAAPAAEGGETEREAPAVPLTFTAESKRFEIQGSRVTPEGVFIPRDQIPNVQRKLSRGTIYESSFRQIVSDKDAEIHQLRTQLETDEDKVKAKAFLTHFAKLLDQGADAVDAWLADFDKNRVKLEAEATLAQARAIREGKEKQPSRTALPGLDDTDTTDTEPDPLEGVDQDELADTLSGLLEENLKSVAAEAGLTILTAADLARLHTRFSDPEELGRFFVYATEDIPELKAKRGDILVKRKALRKELETYADLVGQGRGVKTEAERAREKNAGKGGGAGGGKNAPPPTSATSGGAAGRSAIPKLPKTREQKEEWDKLSDELQDASIKQGVYAAPGEKLVA